MNVVTVRKRLARCTAWVKRWSEAMDFFLSIFKTNISLFKSEAKIYRNWTQNYDLVLRFKSDAKIHRNWTQNYDPVLRFKSDAEIYRNWTQNYDLVLRFKSDAKIYRNWTQIKAIY